MSFLKKMLVAFFCMAILTLFSNSFIVSASENVNNRFNVVIVLDASHSMEYTDPNGWRYEAIQQFIGLLAENGNYLGAVVFSDNVEAEKEIAKIEGDKDKQSVIDTLESVSPMHYTNIGAALDRSVEMLEKNGDDNLRSVIILLSDGNTEMKTKKALKKSREMKADAVESAHDKKINIYSVCLNANGEADFSEMKQISNATGGIAQQVKDPQDLKSVLDMFYNLIYNTSTITLVDENFPASGKIERKFEIPASGVDEVNIIINGSPNKYDLIDPDGNAYENVKKYFSDSFLLLKITDVKPGEWKFVVNGTANEHIKINMVYNTDMHINLDVDSKENVVNEGDNVEIVAYIESTHGLFASQEYDGFTAALNIINDDGEIVDTINMDLSDDKFVTHYTFDEGVYVLQAEVNGFAMSLLSDKTDQITAVKREIINTAPEPVKNPYTYTVYVLPFKKNSHSFDLSETVKDHEGDSLTYSIMSSSFVEGDDYTINGKIITQTGFSLYKGSYDIRVTDSKGLYCDVEIKVRSINVGVLTLILIGVAVLIVAAVLGILLYMALTRPFNGTITISTDYNGFSSCQPRRGRCKLNNFSNINDLGLNLYKCYFQASGKTYITLVTDVPIYCNGQQTKEVRIESNTEQEISVDEDYSRMAYIKFESFMSGGTSYRRRGNVLTDVVDFFADLFNRKRR